MDRAGSLKPGRTGVSCWVAQASPAWSKTHLETEKTDVAERLLALLCDVLGNAPESALRSDAHRWLYAHVENPLGSPFLKDESGRLYLGGDWCLGPGLEAAWLSGTAIAGNLLESRAC